MISHDGQNEMPKAPAFKKGDCVKMKGSGSHGVIDAVFRNLEDDKIFYRICYFGLQQMASALTEDHTFTKVD